MVVKVLTWGEMGVWYGGRGRGGGDLVDVGVACLVPLLAV